MVVFGSWVLGNLSARAKSVSANSQRPTANTQRTTTHGRDQIKDRISRDVQGRQILDALAVEAASILDNARLVERERERQRMEQELNIARDIQQALLPRGFRGRADALRRETAGRGQRFPKWHSLTVSHAPRNRAARPAN